MKVDIESVLAALKMKDRKKLVVLAVSALLLIVDVIFVAIPQVRDLITRSAEIRALGAEIKAVKDDAAKMESYSRALADYERMASSDKARLLSQEQEIPGLIEEISAMARESGVKIIGIRPMRMQNVIKTVGGDVSRDVPIQISAKSGYHEIGEFVGRIENAGKFMKIADLKMRSNRASPRRHDAELLISVYLFSGNGRRLEQG